MSQFNCTKHQEQKATIKTYFKATSILLVNTKKTPRGRTKEPKSMTQHLSELKVIRQTPKHIETAYFKAISALDDDLAGAMVHMTDWRPMKENHWIGNSLMVQARLVSGHTGVDLSDTFQMIREQFTVLFLSHADEKDIKLINSTIKYASVYVQSILFSEKAKRAEAKKGTSFILADGHADNSRTVAIDEAKAMAIDALLDALIKRQDQRDFIKTVLTEGQQKAQETLGLETKRFNEKLTRALASIEKGRNKDEYKYMMSLMGEILETAHDTELTEQEELQAVYAESISIF